MIYPDDGSLEFLDLSLASPPELDGDAPAFFGSQMGLCVHRSDQTMCVVFQQQTIEWTTNDTPARYGPNETEPSWPSLPSPPSPTSTRALSLDEWEGVGWGTIAGVQASWRKEGYWEWDPVLGDDVFKVGNIWTHRKMRWRWRWFATAPYGTCWRWLNVRQQRAAVDYLDTESGIPTPTLQGSANDLTVWAVDVDWSDRDPEGWDDWGGTDWVTWAPEPTEPPDPVEFGPSSFTQSAFEALAILYPTKAHGGPLQGAHPGFVPGSSLPWLLYSHPRGLDLSIGGA